MGRPALPVSEKRQPLSFRLSPSARDTLARAAEKSGRGIPSEIEARLEPFLHLDGKTIDMLAAIAAEIGEVEKHFLGRWHQQLDSWSAVAHALRAGPILQLRPAEAVNDPDASVAWEKLAAAQAQRREIIEKANAEGLAWREDPAPRKKGLFFGGASIDTRAVEARAIESLPPGPHRDELSRWHGELRELDAAIDAAMTEWKAVLQLYANDEAKGREWERARLAAQAKERERRGERVSILERSGLGTWL